MESEKPKMGLRTKVLLIGLLVVILGAGTFLAYNYYAGKLSSSADTAGSIVKINGSIFLTDKPNVKDFPPAEVLISCRNNTNQQMIEVQPTKTRGLIPKELNGTFVAAIYLIDTAKVVVTDANCTFTVKNYSYNSIPYSGAAEANIKNGVITPTPVRIELKPVPSSATFKGTILSHNGFTDKNTPIIGFVMRIQYAENGETVVKTATSVDGGKFEFGGLKPDIRYVIMNDATQPISYGNKECYLYAKGYLPGVAYTPQAVGEIKEQELKIAEGLEFSVAIKDEKTLNLVQPASSGRASLLYNETHYYQTTDNGDKHTFCIDEADRGQAAKLTASAALYNPYEEENFIWSDHLNSVYDIFLKSATAQ